MSSEIIKWLQIQKSLGCLSIEQIGIGLENNTIKFLTNASFKGAVVKIGLEGLTIETEMSLPLSNPTFSLQGLSLGYKTNILEIDGSLSHGKDAEFKGSALIKTNVFSLSTLGAYGNSNNEPYLFIFGYLDYKFGGSPACFIEGLAAAFGYHTKLIQPNIVQIPQFPLVQSARNGPINPTPFKPDTNPAQALEVFEQGSWVVPSLGNNFMSIGVRFSSFNIIDSFMLLTVNFGTEVTISVLGISEIKVPKDSTNFIGYGQLLLEASINPDKGSAVFEGQLSSASYIFSKKCYVTGGFAACMWFGDNKNSGDFVITLGGYSPNFSKPNYYPVVPKLGFNWNFDDTLTIKGDAYFALTPNYAMAGGKLEITFNEGDLHAWLNAEADFLIVWQPFHYDMTVKVDIGVSYTFTVIFTTTISVDVEADLHVWGPEFSGNLHIHLWVVSFTIGFGPQPSALLKPLKWENFNTLLLPSNAENLSGIKVLGGLLKELKKNPKNSNDDIDWIINPTDLIFETYSLVTSKSLSFNGNPVSCSATTDFGIPAMGVQSTDFSSLHIVSVTSISNPLNKNKLLDVSQNFNTFPIIQNVPKALWDKDKKDDSQTTLPNVLTGLKIVPKIELPDKTLEIDIEYLLYDNVLTLPVITWSKPNIPTTDDFDHTHAQEVWLTSIVDNKVAQLRQSILETLVKNNFVVPTTVSISEITKEENISYYLSPPTLHYLGEIR